MTRLPAVCLIANPGRRHRILELATEVERRGFPGIYFPGSGDISMAVSLAHVTNTIEFGTAIQPIYVRTAYDMARAISRFACFSARSRRLSYSLLPRASAISTFARPSLK